MTSIARVSESIEELEEKSAMIGQIAVSYTHLDVYKRQAMGLQVLAAARIAHAGESFKAVLEAAQQTRDRVRFYFVPETLEYLKKGGRIGTASALLGSLLNIRPILTVDMKKGMTHLLEKARGTARALKRMLELMEEDHKKYGLKEIIVHHINAPEKAHKLRQTLIDRYAVPVSIISIGPVIGLHTGLGTVGFVSVSYTHLNVNGYALLL